MSIIAALPQILANIPPQWRGTTFNNSNLLGREGFCESMYELLRSGREISCESLTAVGNAEDYFRVSSNLSTCLELALAEQRGLQISQIFSFASKTMPLASVMLTCEKIVTVYHGDSPVPFTADELNLFSRLGCAPVFTASAPVPSEDGVVVALASSFEGDVPAGVDAVVDGNLLFVYNPENVVPASILVIRKRMATPLTTPVSEAMLQEMAGLPVTADTAAPDAEDVGMFYGHLQQLGGTPVNAAAKPVCFTAGLPALCSLWVTLIESGGADVLMASTAYGGSSQLADLVTAAAPDSFLKHTFDLQGQRGMLAGIQDSLNALAAKAGPRCPTTVLFVEIPTNPDMKVPQLQPLCAALLAFCAGQGTRPLLLLDCTFAPNNGALGQLQELSPSLPALLFLSMSKSVSRGMTTAGCLIANHTQQAVDILSGVRKTARFLDTGATPDQMRLLCANHCGVERRCQDAYATAVHAGAALVEAVAAVTGQSMPLCFVSPEDAALGFTTSTFSFNLPPPPGADSTNQLSERLAQRYVDCLCASPLFKPCVSFGQDNQTVYATVPATSTQGAIKEEDKAKQAVGGVQLTRLSFPPTAAHPGLKESMITAIVQSVHAAYDN